MRGARGLYISFLFRKAGEPTVERREERRLEKEKKRKKKERKRKEKERKKTTLAIV